MPENWHYNVVNGSLRIISEWFPDHFDLKVLKGEKAWASQVTKKLLQNFADQLYEGSLEDYMDKLRKYICSECPDTTLCVEEKRTAVEFVVKRTSRKITKRVFITPLEKIDYHGYVEGLLDSLTLENVKLKEETEALMQQNFEAEKEKADSAKLLDEFLTMKQNGEKRLYSSFLLLLNEKKHRIRFLTELLESRGHSKAELEVKDETSSIVSDTQESTQESMVDVAPPRGQKRFAFLDDDSQKASTSGLPKRSRTAEPEKSNVGLKERTPEREVDIETKKEDPDSYEMNTEEFLDLL